MNAQLEKLVVWEEKWANALGKEEYEKRKKFLMQREVQVDKEIEVCNAKLAEVRNELAKLS